MPDFLIIGAQRCGTTSLWHYLKSHPDINVARKKEVHYFDHRYFSKSFDWYMNWFKDLKGVTGEASPFYIFHPNCSSRIKSKFPDIKLIVLLRNPVDRAYSHYNHEINKLPRDRVEFKSFREAIDLEESRIEGEFEKLLNNERYRSDKLICFAYKKRGLYKEQLERWYDLFDTNNILIISNPSMIFGS